VKVAFLRQLGNLLLCSAKAPYVTLYVSDQLDCMVLRLGMDEEPTESLWLRIQGRAGTGDIIVRV